MGGEWSMRFSSMKLLINQPCCWSWYNVSRTVFIISLCPFQSLCSAFSSKSDSIVFSMHFSTNVPLALLPTAFGQLNTLANAKGLKYFGPATDNPELTDTTYVKILPDTTQFGQITVRNNQKWEYIEPSQNSFSYTQGDAVVSLAANNGQLVRCHNLCWYSQLPSWGMLLHLSFSISK